MKKLTLNLLAISGLALATVACGNGSTAPINAAPAPTTNNVTTPDSATNTAPVTGSPIYVDTTNSTISIPSTATGGVTTYTTVALNASTATTALLAAVTSSSVTSITQRVVNGLAVTVFNAGSTIYVVNQTAARAAADTYEVATGTFTPSTNIIQVPTTSSNVAVVYGLGTAVYYATESTSATLVADTAGTTCSNKGTINTVAGTIYPTTDTAGAYISVGTTAGRVCALIPASSTLPIESSNWTDLTTQAINGGYNPAAAVEQFSFTNLANTTLFGAWLTNGQVWRVTANTAGSPITSTSCTTAGQSCSFWQVNKAGMQTSTNSATLGQTITYTNTPNVTPTAIYSDTNNNLYLANESGFVFKLTAGSTNWSLPVQVGTKSITLSATTLGTGVIATAKNANDSTVVTTVN